VRLTAGQQCVPEETAMIRGVKFVSIPVVDQDRALAFYTEKLGFRVATDQPFDDKQRWIELAIPGAETGVVLFRMDEGPQPGGFMNMSLWTDDVRVTARTLKERGVEFIAEAKKEEWGTSAIFRDSEGNRFVLSSR
jgi:predicted enzyme related to lactoylglutathione lyase